MPAAALVVCAVFLTRTAASQALAPGSRSFDDPEPRFGIRAAPSPQPFSGSNSAWNGYSELMRIAIRELGTARVRPVAKLDYLSLEPSDAVLIVHPTRPLDEQSLSSFLGAGGRVGVLDDFGRSASFLSRFGITHKAAPAHPQQQLRANPNLPIAVPSSQGVEGYERARHPIAADVEEVVTNHPRVFEHPDLTPVLEIRDKSGKAHTLALTGVIAEKGRLFVMGDPSAFINLMVRYPGNRGLARGVLRYLAGPPSLAETNTERTLGTLYIVANDFDEVGSFGQENVWLDTVERRFAEATDALAAIGTRGLPPTLSIGLAAALAAWLLVAQIQGQLRVPRTLSPTYTRAPIFAAQTGLSSRASVLGSASANSALALIEMERALRETVADALELDVHLDPKKLGAAACRAGLSAKLGVQLERTLTELREVESRLSRPRTRPVKPRDLRRLHEASQTILTEMERMRRKS